MADSTKKGQRAGAWLRERTEALAGEIVERHFAADPMLKKKYGPVGRVRCREDATYHLSFLAQAAEASNRVHFIEYVRWAKPMLASRKIPWQHLEANLKIMRSVILDAGPPKETKAFADDAIDEALRILPEAPEEIPSLVDESNPDHKLANEYLRALLSNDREKAFQVVRDAVQERDSIRSVFLNVLAVAQREIGRLWQLNRISVAQEHYCTAATEVIMARITERMLGRPRAKQEKVVAICPQNEEHCVGLQLICELLDLEGWPTHFLGAKVPVSSAVSFVSDIQPAFVLISAATAMRISELADLIGVLKQSVPTTTIVVGGRVFENDAELYKRVGAHATGKDPNDVVTLLERMAA